MKKPDATTLKAITALRHRSEFATFRQWLAESLTENDEKLRTARGDDLAQRQGESQCLARLIERIDNARELADKASR